MADIILDENEFLKQYGEGALIVDENELANYVEPKYYPGVPIPAKTRDELTPEEFASVNDQFNQRRAELADDATKWQNLAEHPFQNFASTEALKTVPSIALGPVVGAAGNLLGRAGYVASGAATGGAGQYLSNKVDDLDSSIKKMTGVMPEESARFDELVKANQGSVLGATAIGAGTGFLQALGSMISGAKPAIGATPREQAAILRTAQATAHDPGMTARVFDQTKDATTAGFMDRYVAKVLTEPNTGIPGVLSKEDVVVQQLPRIMKDVDLNSGVSQAGKMIQNVDDALTELHTARGAIIKQADAAGVRVIVPSSPELAKTFPSSLVDQFNKPASSGLNLSPSEALAKISELDDTIKLLGGYDPAIMVNAAAAEKATAEQIAQRVQGLRDARKQLSIALNDTIGGNRILDLNQKMSALKNFQPFLRQGNADVQSAIYSGLKTKQSTEGYAGEGANFFNRGVNWIVDNNTFSNEGAIRTLNTGKQIAESSFNNLARSFDNIAKIRQGIPVQIPRTWELVKSNKEITYPAIAQLAYQFGIITDPNALTDAPEAIVKQVYKSVAPVASYAFEPVKYGFRSLIDGVFNDPTEREMYRRQVNEVPISLEKKATIESALNQNRFIDYEDEMPQEQNARTAPSSSSNLPKLLDYLYAQDPTTDESSSGSYTESMLNDMTRNSADTDFVNSGY